MAVTKDSGASEGVKSLTGRVYDELRSDLLCGRIPPGKKLRLKDLQTRFDASLSVVREALSRLCSEDLVQALDQRGFISAAVSLEDLKDLAETRRSIEEIAIRQAIARGGATWEAAVTAAYGRLGLLDPLDKDAAIPNQEWIEAHEDFHRTLVEGCGSSWLIRVCAQMSERTQRYRYLSVSMSRRRDAAGEHKQILLAVLARDADRAASLLDEHFSKTQQILIQAWTPRESAPAAAKVTKKVSA